MNSPGPAYSEPNVSRARFARYHAGNAILISMLGGFTDLYVFQYSSSSALRYFNLKVHQFDNMLGALQIQIFFALRKLIIERRYTAEQ